jgi:hypothetical protein
VQQSGALQVAFGVVVRFSLPAVALGIGVERERGEQQCAWSAVRGRAGE